MRVEDVMTTEVLTVTPETPLKEVAELLIERGISGLPVVDAEGRVLGVVSESDILYKEREPESSRGGLLRHLFLRGHAEFEAKLAARTAGEAMTSPAITARPAMSVSEAATLMLERGIDRLVVVDGRLFGDEGADAQLVGIVTRGDFVRAFARPDEEIASEITDVIERQYEVLPQQVSVTVIRGEVALEGEVDFKSTAESLTEAVARVPGVVSLDANLSWRLEEARVTGSEPYWT
jgi:CBS domain-containing protein